MYNIEKKQQLIDHRYEFTYSRRTENNREKGTS